MKTVHSIKIRKGYGNAIFIWIVILMCWVSIQSMAKQQEIINVLDDRKVAIDLQRQKYLTEIGVKDTTDIGYIRKIIERKNGDNKYNKFKKVIKYHHKDKFVIKTNLIKVHGAKVKNIMGVGVIEYDK